MIYGLTDLRYLQKARKALLRPMELLSLSVMVRRQDPLKRGRIVGADTTRVQEDRTG